MKSPLHIQISHDDPDAHASNDESAALAHFQRDVGLNYDASFGSLLDDTAAADVAYIVKEHPITDD
jgi:hypothetical protein